MRLSEIINSTIKEYMDSLNNDQGLVVYHGTPDNLNIEDIEPNKRLRGLYTTTDKNVAKEYSHTNGKIFSFKIKPTAKILNLGDGDTLYEWMANNELLDDDDLNNIDLEYYIKDGRIFQYDISSNTHLANDIISTAEDMGYDVVILVDDLGSYDDNLAYVIMNMNTLIPIGEVNI